MGNHGFGQGRGRPLPPTGGPRRPDQAENKDGLANYLLAQVFFDLCRSCCYLRTVTPAGYLLFPEVTLKSQGDPVGNPAPPVFSAAISNLYCLTNLFLLIATNKDKEQLLSFALNCNIFWYGWIIG